MEMTDTSTTNSAADTLSAEHEITPIAICNDMWRLLKSYKTHMAVIAERHHLTTIQLGALHAINEGQITMGKVAQSLHCDASNVTGIIDRLTALKFVVRQEDPRDRRVKSLQLTRTGTVTLKKILDEMPSALGCDRLNRVERQQMHDLVNKLAVSTNLTD